MKRISIIIPVYNAEKYLEKCLDSIIPQITNDDEIILIDDCSKDSSLAICKEYETKNNNIKVISQKCGGPSKTRNVGIENAQGQYLAFIDSDDYLGKNYISKMLENVEKYDLKVCGYSFVIEETNNATSKIFDDNESREISKNEIIFLYEKELLSLVWNKIYHANIIKKNNIRFDESVTKGEDLLFNLDYILHINTPIYVINEELYYYISKKTGINKSFKEPIENRISRTNRMFNKFMEISNKNNNYIINCIIDLYFLHLRNYKNELNLKNIFKIRKIWLEQTNTKEFKNIIDKIELGSKPNLKLVKKAYENKFIITMFLVNKIKLKLSRKESYKK